MQSDEELTSIADYVHDVKTFSPEILETARYCLADALGCAVLSLQFKECVKLLGPVVPGTIVPKGSRVPGTEFVLDPIRAAFNIGTMIRWLDYNDTWLAAEWGHPSDNIGGLLAIGDYISQTGSPILMRDLLIAIVKAYEIQGNIALHNSFNRIGLDHVILVKVATAAVVAGLLGLSKNQIIDTLSHAWVDAGPLRTYRHKPNTGSRKSWAAGDATSRGVMFALMVEKGEMGYPTALTAKQWGFYDVLFKGNPFKFSQPFGSYVMENILFKIAFPAEFHAQTAVEAAFKLHGTAINRLQDIERIEIQTHEAAIRIIDKKGKLNNPADRDHCLQYMVAVGLLHGHLTAEHYENEFAQDPRIDLLREKMVVSENKEFSHDYLDPDKRSISNAVQIFFSDGTSSEKILIEYPLGHRKRRQEAIPLLMKKLKNNLETHYDSEHVAKLMNLLQDQKELEQMPVQTFVNMWV